MPNINAPAWKALVAHHAQFSKVHLRDLFASDPQRFARFSVVLEGLLVDFSKQRIDATTLRVLIDLAETAKLAALGTALGVSLDWLLSDAEPEEPEAHRPAEPLPEAQE